MPPINHRFDEFLQASLAQLILAEAIKVPAASPYYVPLREVPREQSPSTVLVRNAASSSSNNPDQDCSVFQSTNSNDNGTQLYFGREFAVNGGGLFRAFIRFNIAALPSSPSSVKLRVYVVSSYQETSVPVSVHQVTSSWTETGPTWSSQPTYNTSPASAFAATPAGPKSPPSGWYECDITSLYNTWKAGTNNGLMLKTDESVYGNLLQINSRSGSQPPQLVIVSAGNVYTEVGTFVAPGPGEYACHYGTGRLRFHSSAAGLDLLVDYRGIGSSVDAQDVPVWLGTTSGTNTYTATTTTSVTLVPNLIVAAKIGTGNTGAATLNVNGTGAKSIKRFGGALSSGQLVAGAVYLFAYDGTDYHVIGV